MPRHFDPHDALRERVRLAEPVARRILLAGLGGLDRDEYARQTLHDFVKELTGYGAPVPLDASPSTDGSPAGDDSRPAAPPAGASGTASAFDVADGASRPTAFAQYEENLYAAYALGIALGLMLHMDEGTGDASGA